MRINIKHPEIFSAFFNEVTKMHLNRPIGGISTDSRQIKENDLFIALEGKNYNGNDFLQKVLKNGASAALVSKINKNLDFQQIKVKSPLETLNKLANLWREQFEIPVIAITGSNGKTSTKELLSHILSCKYNIHFTKGNFNTSIGLSLTLLELDNSHNISIIELGSSSPGEIKKLCDISKPTHGLITNIAPAHLEGFGTIEKIIKEKSQLFNSLKKGISFVNKTDKKIEKLKFEGEKITFGLTPDCDFPADINIEQNGTLTLIINSHIIQTNSYNLSFIKNSLSCAAISMTLGINKKELKSKIQSFVPPAGRCYVKHINGVTIIDDTYNANLISSIAALEYLNAFSGEGRKIFVFGDMFELGDKSSEQHIKIGKKCSKLKIDSVFTIGEETRHTYSAIDNQTIHEHFNSREKMIDSIKNYVRPGDKILFKGSRGMKMEKIIEGVFTY